LDGGSSNRNSAGALIMSGDRDSLLLAAREVGRAAVEESLETKDARDFLDTAIDFELRRLEPSEPERNVVVDRHVRVESVVLEHHRDIAVGGRRSLTTGRRSKSVRR
jgi:hypothetical protein